MFYHYRQNNSGGKYHGPVHVNIEANSARQANALARNCGIYFDGVRKGRDCECCGDRWSEADETDGKPFIHTYGIVPEKGDIVSVYYLDEKEATITF